MPSIDAGMRQDHPALALSSARALGVAAPMRWHFLALCAYLAGQAYLIPLVAKGPSWAIWPRIADLAIGALFLAYMAWLPTGEAVSPVHRRILGSLVVGCGYCCVSFAVFTMIRPSLYGSPLPSDKASVWGVYQLVRLVQFTFLFYAVSAVPLGRARQGALATITAAVLVLLCALVPLTYFGAIDHRALVAHLPDDPGTAGPWASFGAAGDSGLGTISYNHAYVGCQLILLFVLRLSLTATRFDWINASLLVLTCLAVFLSGSRASFGAMLVLAATCMWLWTKLGHMRAIVSIAAMGCAVALIVTLAPSRQMPASVGSVLGENDEILARQFSTFQGYEAENLSGRTEIWSDRIRFLNEEPLCWVFGSGFGSAVSSGAQGHMLPLNTVLEIGAIGLLVGLVVLLRIMTALWRMEPPGRPVFWGTVALLITSLTQETFYPVPAMGHFPGFYLFTVAIALRLAADASVDESSLRASEATED
ncbi:MAG: O-antigen ligase family protein [Pirellulales bacterium]|nr:O-antigen ligase family protein [Pirellulales bacterium]